MSILDFEPSLSLMPSFSFRNILSSDEAELGPSATAGDDGRVGQAPDSPNRSGGEVGRLSEGRHRRILASELLPYIPKAIAAQSGIPMERELLVPLPADGSLDVKLSALYQSCPELFAAEITPLNDSVVTLPPRLGGDGEHEGFALVLKKPSLLGGFDAPEANPFRAPFEGSAKDAPGALPAIDGAASTSSEKHSPLLDNPANPEKGSAKQQEGFDLTFAPFYTPVKAIPVNEASEKEKGTGFFGFTEGPPATKPESSKPSADFPDSGDFETIFSAAAKFDAAVAIPSAEPEDPARESKVPETLEKPEGTWGAMFSGSAFEEEGKARECSPGSFEGAPFDNIGELLEQGAAPATGFATVGFEASAAPSRSDAGVSPAAKVEDLSGFAFAAGLSDFAPASAETPAIAKFSAPKPANPPTAGQGGESSESAPADPFAAFLPRPEATAVDIDEPPAAQPAAAGPQGEASPGPAQVFAPSPVFAPIEVPSETASAASGEEDDELRDLELRAIFSTSEHFTLSLVARHVVGLPGISSCSLSTPAELVQASRREDNRLGGEAREMVSTLRKLATLTGLNEARTFTLQTDRGVLSLFLEGEHCVMVQQETAAFEPGVREKLILVARSLVKLHK